jgi:hypothetical protein
MCLPSAFNHLPPFKELFPYIISGTGYRVGFQKILYRFSFHIKASPNKNSQGNKLPPQELPLRFLKSGEHY